MLNKLKCVNVDIIGLVTLSLDAYFPSLKDTIDEDVEQQRKTSSQRLPSSGTVEEVHEEENGGYDYDDDDFEVWGDM